MSQYKTTIGNVEILALSDGSIRFAPSDFFPTIPAHAWQPYSNHLTPQGDMILNLGCFLLRSQGKTILIDTGLGQDSGHLETPETGNLIHDMQTKGISPTQVDIVAITHLHIDHVGWNFLPNNSHNPANTRTPTFPNARYYVHQADWRVFTRGALRKSPYISDQVLPLQEQNLLELFQGEQPLTDEVSTLPTPGHTPGHTSYLISSHGEKAVITGDAIHIQAQAHETHWSPRADSKPDTSAQTRHNLLHRIEQEHAMLISGHFPTPGFGTLQRINGNRFWQAL